jgi:DNA-binding transcriptional ArsR family regulator
MPEKEKKPLQNDIVDASGNDLAKKHYNYGLVTNSCKPIKLTSKLTSTLLFILRNQQNNVYASQISKAVNLSRAAVHKHINKLKELNIVEETGITWPKCLRIMNFYELVNQFKQGVNFVNLIRVDASIRLKMPIETELENPYPSDINRVMRGWISKYHFKEIPYYDIGLTLQKTPKNLIVYVHHLQVQEPEDLEKIVNLVKRWCREYFASKRVMILDEIGTTASYIKYGIFDARTKQAVPKGRDENIDLGRLIKPVLPADEPQEARVWLDKTPFDFTIHSNDQTYVKKYLLMPETLDRLGQTFVPAIEALSVQIEKHLDVLDRIGKAIDKLTDKIDLLGGNHDR